MHPQAPPPRHILRTHGSPVTVVYISNAKHGGSPNQRLYTGDADGIVAVTSTETLRPLAIWKAHEKGLLGVEEWKDLIVTHGRDNKLHLWKLNLLVETIADSASEQAIPTPMIVESLDVNALNFCRFSLLDANDFSCLIALPNLIESSWVDIWQVPGSKRLHAASGKVGGESLNIRSTGETRSGIVMALHLLRASTATGEDLRLLVGYENGTVVYWSRTWNSLPSINGGGWEVLWHCRPHVDAVMCMAVSQAGDFALTVSADSLVAHIQLNDNITSNEQPTEDRMTIHQTKYPGNSSLSIRGDGRVCAIGGWDGKIRLYSTKTLKSLGTLNYHKGACNALAFADYYDEITEQGNARKQNYEDMSGESRDSDISRWLAAGGMDRRVTIWELMSFERTGRGS